MRDSLKALVLAASMSVLAGCGSDGNRYASRPSFLVAEPTRTDYDGITAGLLTGAAPDLPSLLKYTAPSGADPTPAVLRTLQISASYAGLLDLSAAGGFGTYFGKLDALANQGTEYLAVSDDGSGKLNVALAVQISGHFDPVHPCIVSATSSGSRGIYGAVPTTGEWGLNKGCAVAYADKGTGTGAHDLDGDRAYAFDGTLVAAAQRKDLTFNANLLGDDLATFRAAHPSRFALKHLHSKQNPEKDWGTSTLQAIRLAFYVLNKHFPSKRFAPDNTIVIASSISNGGGAAILAAEQDTDGMIGGLLQPCATQAPAVKNTSIFVNAAAAANRCAALAQLGLVNGATTAAQATDALARLHGYGWEPESDLLHDSHYGFEFTSLVATTYASAYARASVVEAVCGYSVGGVGSTTPGAPPAAALKTFAATGSGLAAGPVTIINDNAVGGPAKDTQSVTASTQKADYNVDGALCLRRLMTGAGVGSTSLSPAESALAARVRAGMSEIRVSGNLRGKPAILVQGRADTLIPVNHASRPYAALNRRADSKADLHYYEVTDANHFDALVAYYPRVLAPLHVYGLRALDLMYARLASGAALPPSQVVRATARASSSATLNDTNVPPIAAAPAPADAIAVSSGSIVVPD